VACNKVTKGADI